MHYVILAARNSVVAQKGAPPHLINFLASAFSAREKQIERPRSPIHAFFVVQGAQHLNDAIFFIILVN